MLKNMEVYENPGQQKRRKKQTRIYIVDTTWSVSALHPTNIG